MAGNLGILFYIQIPRFWMDNSIRETLALFHIPWFVARAVVLSWVVPAGVSFPG